MAERRMLRQRRRSAVPVEAPPVQLGQLLVGGLAPAILAIVERGVNQRPELARSLDAEVELIVQESYPPVRIVFGSEGVLVEDGPAQAPNLSVHGELADLIGLLVAPAWGGVPLPISRRGRSAVAMVASRRVRIRGRIALLRRFMCVIRI